MSDITRSNGINRTYEGGMVEIRAEESLNHALKIMQGFPAGAHKAVGAALARAAASAKTVAKRMVTRDYTLSSGTFLAYTRNINHHATGSGVEFGFAGRTIPLIKFEHSVNDKGVVVNVRRSTGSKQLNHVFNATMFGHNGLFERDGAKRYPVHELFGPSTPQMMWSDEEVTDKTYEKAIETFEKRIDHEILRVMNGWGK